MVIAMSWILSSNNSCLTKRTFVPSPCIDSQDLVQNTPTLHTLVQPLIYLTAIWTQIFIQRSISLESKDNWRSPWYFVAVSWDNIKGLCIPNVWPNTWNPLSTPPDLFFTPGVIVPKGHPLHSKPPHILATLTSAPLHVSYFLNHCPFSKNKIRPVLFLLNSSLSPLPRTYSTEAWETQQTMTNLL